MYEVSQAYITKMFDQVQTHRLRGTINDIPFTEADVKDVSYSDQCSDKNVLIGSVNIGKLKLTFTRALMSRGAFVNKKLTIYDGLLLGLDENNHEVWEDVPIGTFYVGEATWTAQGMIEVTAYTCLSLMDKNLDFDQTSGTMYDYLNLIALKTGAVLGMTEVEVNALPNGTHIIAPYPDNDMTTFRDLLSKLAQLAGGFAYAKRDGSFAIKSFETESILSIPEIRRYENAKYSDYHTRFDYLSYVDNKDTGSIVYVGNPSGVGMDIGGNPFIQFGTPAVRKSIAEAIFAIINDIHYTPYQVGLLPGFCALDIGDVITFSDDYTAEDSTGAIMSVIWQYNKKFQVQCFGSNPNLVKAKSATDNAVAGARSSGKEQKILTYTSVNAEDIDIHENEKTQVLRTVFSTSDPNTILTLSEIKFETLEEDEVVEVFYYLNGVEQNYVPTDTYSEAGLHTLSLMYPLNGLNAGSIYTFTVKMRTTGGGAHIDMDDAHQYVQGAGLDSSSKWTGFLELDDIVDLTLGDPFYEHHDGGLTLTTQQPHPITISDGIDLTLGNPLYTLHDSGATLVAVDVIFKITDEEDDGILLQEDGGEITTEGGYL